MFPRPRYRGSRPIFVHITYFAIISLILVLVLVFSQEDNLNIFLSHQEIAQDTQTIPKPVIAETEPNISDKYANNNFVLTKKPKICITFISCGRSDYLNQTIFPLMDHVHKYEKKLRYELHWIDQAMRERQYFNERLHFHKRVYYYKALGYQTAFKTAFFICQAPYILLMEEDFLLVRGEKVPFIKYYIEILKNTNASLYGLLVRTLYKEGPIRKYDVITQNYGQRTAYGFAWRRYGWNNGAIIMKMREIQWIMNRTDYVNEFLLGRFARNHGYHYGYSIFTNDTWENATHFTGYMEHIGEASTHEKKQYKTACDQISWE